MGKMKERLAAAVTAAKKAGVYLREEFTRAPLFAYTYKDSYNVVSGADIGAEKIILEILRARFPRDIFFAEERGWEEGDSAYTWIVDALDGTSNFTRKITHFCVSIALWEKGSPALGVVYQPLTDELFVAQHGKGAMLNKRVIRPQGEKLPERAVLFLGRGGTKEDRRRHGRIFHALVGKVRSIRILGATALDLCMVACGRADGFVGNGINFYDIAAAGLIAREAGAVMTTFKGTQWRLRINEKSDVIATHQPLSKPFISLLKKL